MVCRNVITAVCKPCHPESVVECTGFGVSLFVFVFTNGESKKRSDGCNMYELTTVRYTELVLERLSSLARN